MPSRGEQEGPGAASMEAPVMGREDGADDGTAGRCAPKGLDGQGDADPRADLAHVGDLGNERARERDEAAEEAEDDDGYEDSGGEAKEGGDKAEPARTWWGLDWSGMMRPQVVS
ncbi:hypothetical protein CDD83_3781 [Cordyceps sp. RAO-2017]|nr:hypothetical protein CDD83_3781 [Cordyceps sp. RAO-2017]